MRTFSTINSLLHLISTLGLVSCVGGGEIVSIKDIKPSDTDFYLIERPFDRAADKPKYFSHEYVQINQRRNDNYSSLDSSRPAKLVGLALSGGGQRSAAFQLGILSGFNEGRIKNSEKNILSRVDYISSVSGGGWGNGAYWASSLSDNELFNCLNEAVEKGMGNVSSDCQKPARMLRTEQKIDWKLSFREQRKERWEKDLETMYLPDGNVDFSKKEIESNRWQEHLSKKPYPIFNSSHSVSVSNQKSSIKNFPFQVTPDYLGTIVDCKSGGITVSNDSCEKGEGNTGFFVRQNANEYEWSQRKWQRWWKFWASEDASEQGTTLSKAMATSSGVISAATLLQYNFDLQFNDNYIKELRKIYKLSDGGKTENLGLLPLIERGVNLIVVSYMGKDSDSVKNPFEDFKLASEQSNKLLKCDAKMPESKDKLASFIFRTSYKCNNSDTGVILHVKPTHENINEFIDYLSNQSKYADVANYLKVTDKKQQKKDQFPQTPTMKMKYDERLIRAYFLLGQYIAKKYINTEIDG